MNRILSIILFASIAISASAVEPQVPKSQTEAYEPPRIESCVAVQEKQAKVPAGVNRLWGRTSYFWPQKAKLRVRFLTGTAGQRAEAWKRFQYVDSLTSLTFVQVSTGTSEIRVRFDLNNGHWSYLGKGSLTIAQSAKTMNLALSSGFFGDNAKEWDRVAIHEIMHAIGFEHEQQSPSSSIPWNREAVYQYYGSTQGWSRAEIDRQVLNRYSGTASFVATTFDKDSIMQYPVPATLTTNGFTVGWNAKLSPLDFQLLQQTYPPPVSVAATPPAAQ